MHCKLCKHNYPPLNVFQIQHQYVQLPSYWTTRRTKQRDIANANADSYEVDAANENTEIGGVK